MNREVKLAIVALALCISIICLGISPVHEDYLKIMSMWGFITGVFILMEIIAQTLRRR